VHEALEILTLGPREWPALLRVPRLWKVESLFWAFYLLRFPSLDIWLQTRALGRPREDFRFGETPYSTGLEILREARLGPEDVFYDLGAGRGKMTFLAALASGGRAVGLEMLASYPLVGNRIVGALGLHGRVEFRHADFLREDLGEATVLYTAATSWSGETRAALLARADELAPGTRWISVGWECRHPRLELLSARRLLFSWGRDDAWFYRVREGLHATVAAQAEDLVAPADGGASQGEDPEDQVQEILQGCQESPAGSRGPRQEPPA